MKANVEKKITESWPKFLDNAEKEKQIAATIREVEQLEIIEEQMIVELEALGAKIERRADLTPSVLLEYKSARDWNRAKLDSLWASVRASQQQISDVQSEYRDLASGEMQQRRLLHLDRYGESKATIQSRIAEIKGKMAANQKKVATLTNELAPKMQLHNACVSFLKSKGIDVEGSGSWSLAS